MVLFPFEATVTLGPSSTINPSTDWDGAPNSFFNDVNCTGAPNSDCFRWEEYSAPLAPGATSAARTVGFEINKDVQAFDVVMLVAADLLNVTPAPAVLALSPTTAAFTSANGTMSQPASVVVYNSGGGTITGLTATVDYAAGQPTGWLTASLGSTTATATLILSANSSALTDGTYNATVSVASAGVSNSPQTVAVTLVVTAAPVASAIYVSESDATAVDDSQCGFHPAVSPGGHPCRSIAQGLNRAVATGRSEVLVADGRYNEAVTLVNGKNLLGGYNPETWQRHVETTNTIIEGVSSISNHDRTIIASGITVPTVFEGFVVRGSHNTKLGGNSYAIYVSGSTADLEIRRNVIYGGTGGPGPQGAGAFGGGASTSDGIGRNPANPAPYDAKIATGSGQCDASNNRSYANGGIWIAGVDNISGGNGGGNSCPTSSTLTQMSAANGIAGQPGAGPGGGLGGLAGAGGLDFRLESGGTVCVAGAGSQLGTNGGNGGNGANGSAVSGAASGDGTVVGSHWVGAAGPTGNIGSNGGGGGGGGAGAVGGAYWVAPPEGMDRLGGHGGGGGAGGNGGGAGGGGSAGGGAFGIFIVGTAPVASDNAIVRGTGGAGGAGGTGGLGLNGGRGASGGVSEIFCAGAAGRGGDGGRGGIGSGGGGGAGGASYGIYTSGAGTPDYCTTANNTVSGGTAGAGGQGGTSPGNAGGAGVSGVLATCSFH